MGITGKLFSVIVAYFAGRYQRVNVGNDHSDYVETTSGGPQGSVIVLFCWLIYINDLSSLIEDSFFGIFVDDVSLYLADPDQNSAVSRLQNNLTRIYSWSITNHMIFNFKKFSIIDVGNKSFSKGKLDTLIFGTGSPPVAKTSKFLGCLVDSDLKFIPQIKYITGKMERCLPLLQKSANTRNGASPARLFMMFSSFVFSKLEYASCIWIFRVFSAHKVRCFDSDFICSPFLPQSKPIHGYNRHFDKLNRAFMKCMRLIIGAHCSASNIAVLVRLGVMPLHYMLAYRASLWFLKIFNDETDPLLIQQWKDVSSNDEILEFTSLYKGCYQFITRLNELTEEDIFSCSES